MTDRERLRPAGGLSSPVAYVDMKDVARRLTMWPTHSNDRVDSSWPPAEGKSQVRSEARSMLDLAPILREKKLTRVSGRQASYPVPAELYYGIIGRQREQSQR
jgi:hypothetical protein